MRSDPNPQPATSADECLFEVNHQTHSPVKDFQVHPHRNPFDQLKETSVDDLVSNEEGRKEGVPDVVLDQCVKDIQFCAWSDKTCE